jgi:uncharacterized protein YndB with AHSA1/START domain
VAIHRVSASRLIAAPARKVYDIIADYHNGHPRILPKPYFLSLNVEKGGYGAGTVINFQMQLMGRIQSFHSSITEPEPGHTLVETDSNTGAITTFTIDPRSTGKEALVTITTTTTVPDGVLGKVQGWLTTRLLHPIYEKELAQLAAVAAEQGI